MQFALRGGGVAEIRGENLVAGEQIYPMRDIAWVGLVVDPATDLPTTGPPIASVEYLVNLDPDNDIFSILGASMDASSHFSLSFTVVPFEPFIKSIPFDSSGNAIVITGVDGQNVAVGVAVVLEPVPEPSTIALVGSGGAIIFGFAWCRRRHNR